MSRSMKKKETPTAKRGGLKKRDEKPQLLEKQKLEERLSRPISELKLPGMHKPVLSRVKKSLEENGVKTFGDLVKLTDEDLQGMRYVRGEKTIRLMKRYLKQLGLSLGMKLKENKPKPVKKKKQVAPAPVAKKKRRNWKDMSDDELVKFGRKVVKDMAIEKRNALRNSDLPLYDVLRRRNLLGKVFKMAVSTKAEEKSPKPKEAKKPKATAEKAPEPKAQEPKVRESEATEKEQEPTVKEALVLDTGLDVDSLHLLVRNARFELDKLLRVVQPEVVENLDRLLGHLRFPPYKKENL